MTPNQLKPVFILIDTSSWYQSAKFICTVSSMHGMKEQILATYFSFSSPKGHKKQVNLPEVSSARDKFTS